MQNVDNTKRRVNISKDNPSLQRIEKRCINCGMCFRICENVVGINHEYEKDDPLCINCGQCIMNCPVGALATQFDYKKVLNLVKDTDKLVAISIAPAVRVSLSSEFGLELGLNMENILPSILRSIGFDYVFDVTFGADVTIMEEANELLSRLNTKKNLPMFTSCCPSWIKYASIFHPELIPNLSTTKSPIGIQSTLIKTYFKELNAIDKDIVSVVVAPCTAKKAEIEGTDTDYIITTRELAMMIRECNIELKAMKPSNFDPLLSKGSKSGTMFGRSGGVMDAALNYVYYLLTKKNPPINYFKLDIVKPITKRSYKIKDKTINVAVVYSMKNFEEIRDELQEYDFIEVMNCPGGCVGGGGQPLGAINSQLTDRETRTKSLNEDLNNPINYCYLNPDITELYRSYLKEPLSKKSIKLLHTKHKDMSNLIK